MFIFCLKVPTVTILLGIINVVIDPPTSQKIGSAIYDFIWVSTVVKRIGLPFDLTRGIILPMSTAEAYFNRIAQK